MSYYLGGYYLVALRPLMFGSKSGRTVHTASDCINDNLVNSWAHRSAGVLNTETRVAKKTFDLDDKSVADIREWVGLKYQEEKIGWVNVFVEAQDALECKETFYPHVKDVEVIGLYFDADEMRGLIEEFEPESDKQGEIGVYKYLLQRIPENENSFEELLGFDLLGFEFGGDFHSFHCHDIGAELSERFGLTLNEYGLFESHDDWRPVLDYLNSEENGCEPVPWFVAKMTRVKIE